MGGVRTGCLGLFGFRLITLWSVCVVGFGLVVLVCSGSDLLLSGLFVVVGLFV